MFAGNMLAFTSGTVIAVNKRGRTKHVAAKKTRGMLKQIVDFVDSIYILLHINNLYVTFQRRKNVTCKTHAAAMRMKRAYKSS